MGYTFRVGNATPYNCKEDGELRAGWKVAGVKDLSAPAFPHDELSNHCNQRHPSYSAWHEFCYLVGIEDVFYQRDRPGHLKADHPGCQMLTHNDLEIVRLATAKWSAKSTLPPGFGGFDFRTGKEIDLGKYDPMLARLLWLEWWIGWALKNCETPAIQNT